MSNVVVYKSRTNVVTVNLGFDVSGDTFESDIRAGRSMADTLIAEWVISFETDGINGVLRFTLDDSVTSLITQKIGYMDIKRITAGEPVPVLDKPIKVEFRESVTE